MAKLICFSHQHEYRSSFTTAILARHGRVNTGVITEDANEGSVPFSTDRIRVLPLCVLTHWADSVSVNGKGPSYITLIITSVYLQSHVKMAAVKTVCCPCPQWQTHCIVVRWYVLLLCCPRGSCCSSCKK